MWLLAWYNDNLKFKVKPYFQTVKLNSYLALVIFFYLLFIYKISNVLRLGKDEVTQLS